MTDSATTQGTTGTRGSGANGANGAHGANGMRAITIARLYGSGGGEIARRIATQLGWRLVDHEVIVELAHQLGITEE